MSKAKPINITRLHKKLSRGRPYKKVYCFPFHKHYFLYVDDANAQEWFTDEPLDEEDEVVGICCHIDSFKLKHPHCLGVIVAPRNKPHIIVHEICHAVSYFINCVIIKKRSFKKCSREEQDDSLEEGNAMGVEFMYSQIVDELPFKEILKEFAHVKLDKKKKRSKVKI